MHRPFRRPKAALRSIYGRVSALFFIGARGIGMPPRDALRGFGCARTSALLPVTTGVVAALDPASVHLRRRFFRSLRATFRLRPGGSSPPLPSTSTESDPCPPAPT